MVMHMSVDDRQVTPTLNTMKQELRDLNATWRANVEAAKAAGDNLEATKAKADGLTKAAEKQKEILEFTNGVLRNTGERTAENSNAYDRLVSQIDRADAQYKNLNNQLQVAQTALERQETGIDELNKSIKANEDFTQSQIKSLKQQGDEYAANELKVKSLEDKKKSLQDVADKEEAVLKKVAERTGESSRAYTEQATTVQNAKNKIFDVNKEMERYAERIDSNNVKLKDLKKTYSDNKEQQDSYITRLKEEGKTSKANVVDLDKLKTAYQNLGNQYKIQTDQLAATPMGTEKFKNLYIEANKTAGEMARVSNQAKKTQIEVNKLHPYGMSAIGEAFNKTGNAAEYMGKKTVNAYQYIRRNALLVTVAVGGVATVIGKGVKEMADLQDSYVKTNNLLVTGGEKQAEVTENITQMQKDGQKMSIEYGKSQQEIADGYLELVKRGYTSKQALGAMRTELQASVSTGDEFNSVVAVSSQVLDAYGLRVDSVTQMQKNTKDVVNQLSYAADLTATDFHSMGKAMEYVADTAASAKIPLNESSTAIGILSNHGLEADKAGTGLRKVINSLTGALGDQINAMDKSAAGQAKMNQKIDEQTKKVQEAQDAVNKATEAEKNNTKGKKGFARQTEAANKQLKKQQDNLDKLQGKAQAAAGAQDMLSSLGISRDQLVKSNGELRSMSDIMKVLNDKTKDIKDVDVKNNIFHALFGTTGMQAGIILAQNNDEIEKLAGSVKKSADGQGYVATLAEKNMQSTKQQMNQLNSVATDISMTLGAAMLPAINKAAKELRKGFDSEGGQKFLKGTAKWLGKIASALVDMATWMGEHSGTVKAFAGILIGIFAVNRVGKFISSLRNAVGVFGDLKKAAIAFKDVDFISSLPIPGLKKSGAKGVEEAIDIGSRASGDGGGIAKKPGLVRKSATLVGDGFAAIGGGVVKGAELIGKGAKNAFTYTASLATSGISKSVDIIKTIGKSASSAFKYTAKLAWSGVKTAVGGMIKFLKEPDKYIKYTAKLMWSGVKKTISLIKTAGKSVGRAFVWTAKLAWTGVKTAISSIPKLVKGIPSLFRWTANLATSAFKKALSTIKGLASSTGGGIKKSLKWIASVSVNAAKKTITTFKTFAIASGKAIKKAVSVTAKVSTAAAKKALAGLLTAAKITGTGMKAAFNWAKANPIFLIITVVTTLITTLYELYKHNKKFRDFTNGLLKGVIDFAKGIGRWLSDAWKTTKKIFGEVINFFKNDWKEVLLFIVNPFAGAFALLYKHNDKFRKNVNDLVADVVGFFKDMGKNISNIFNGIKDFLSDTGNKIAKTWGDTWRGISDFFSDIWKGMKRIGSDAINNLHDNLFGVLGKIGKIFSDTWKGVKDGFSDLWDSMKKLAADGINMVIHPINDGIGGINGIIHDFGGPKHTIGKIDEVKFANGTGAFANERRPITKPTLALLNDGYDSPETGNKEALVHPNGEMEVVQGTNVNRWLAPGTEVLNAKELAMLMGATPYASGTGFFGSIWDGLKGAGSWVGKVAGNAWDGMKDGAEKFTKMLGYITDAVAHPIESLTKKFNPTTDGKFGTVFNAFGDGAFGKATDSVKGWWSELWGMAKGASDTGDVDGQGDNYPWKSVGKDSGADPWGYFYRECVSYVANSLKNMGVSTSLFSGLGNGSDWVNAPVRHTNDPKPGMVAVYGPGSEFGNHAAMVRGVKGNTFSGEEYNWGGDGNYHTYSGRSKSGVTTFLDFGKSGGSENGDGVEANNPLQKLIKSQVGGMFDWIQKFIGPVNDTSTGVGGDVQSWSNDVKKALSQLGLSTSPSMIQKVLRQIQTESGGNPRALGGNDGLADGNATGLMQVKPGTFNAYALPGHHNIMNGYDNMLAGLNYAKDRYGSDLGFLGNGHGYANGGIITKHQIAQLGEGNQPEVVIPFDKMKSSRGFELLGQTVTAFAARDGLTGQGVQNDYSDDKLDKIVILLTQILEGQGNPVTAIMSAVQAQSELNKLKVRNDSITSLSRG